MVFLILKQCCHNYAFDNEPRRGDIIIANEHRPPQNPEGVILSLNYLSKRRRCDIFIEREKRAPSELHRSGIDPVVTM